MSRDASRTKRRRRLARWAFFAIVAGALYVGILRRFSLTRLDIATVNAMAPSLRAGAIHLVDRRPSFALARDWIVWWSYQEGAVFSRIVAMPGDRVERRDGRWMITRGDEVHMLRPEVELASAWSQRTLEPSQYLLLNDDLGSRWPDSRSVGPVDRERILARVLFAFGGS